MCSETFLRLPEEKKHRFLEAAWEEFSRVPFMEASINKIVLRARIPRGSFYQYFSGKDDLFFYLLTNKNIALSREKLISEVWGYDFFGDARTLDTHIKLLRKSLGKYADRIVTLRGVGYRFEGV